MFVYSTNVLSIYPPLDLWMDDIRPEHARKQQRNGHTSISAPTIAITKPHSRFCICVRPKHWLPVLPDTLGPQPLVMVRPSITGPALLRTVTCTELRGCGVVVLTTVASVNLPLSQREPPLKARFCGPSARSRRVVW